MDWIFFQHVVTAYRFKSISDTEIHTSLIAYCYIYTNPVLDFPINHAYKVRPHKTFAQPHKSVKLFTYTHTHTIYLVFGEQVPIKQSSKILFCRLRNSLISSYPSQPILLSFRSKFEVWGNSAVSCLCIWECFFSLSLNTVLVLCVRFCLTSERKYKFIRELSASQHGTELHSIVYSNNIWTLDRLLAVSSCNCVGPNWMEFN